VASVGRHETRVGDQNGSSTLGKGRVYQTLKNVLEASGTLVEVLLVVSVNTMFM
jgi:hypothetical protein